LLLTEQKIGTRSPNVNKLISSTRNSKLIIKARAATESHQQGMQQTADKHTLSMITSAQAADQKAKTTA